MKRFLDGLWRGSSSGYVNFSKRVDGHWLTRWLDLSSNDGYPELGEGDRWFSVNVSREIPQLNARGKPVEPQYVRTRRGIVSEVGVLYAEFDGGYVLDKHNDVLALDPFPSIVVASSRTGYHCYWLLDEPFVIHDKAGLKTISDLQRRWVKSLTGADHTVHDISRVLRVPGTVNAKYDPPEPVAIRSEDYGKRYRLSDLAALLPEEQKSPVRTGQYRDMGQSAQANQLAKLIPLLPPEAADNYDDWVKFGGSLRHLEGAGEALWHMFSALSSKYDPEQCDAKWPLLPHDELGIGTAFWFCSQYGIEQRDNNTKGWNDVARGRGKHRRSTAGRE